jgi:hypothetical protein
MTRIVCAMFVILSAGAMSRGADLYVNGAAYSDVRILTVADASITFAVDGARTLTKPLADVAKISWPGSPLFNAAEIALAKGDFAAADAGYRKAATSADNAILQALILERQAYVARQKNAPRLPVASAPASRPASRPASTRPAWCEYCKGTGVGPCPACNGTGLAKCPDCGGTGRVKVGRKMDHCLTCGGTGRTSCPVCGGTKRVPCRRCQKEAYAAALAGKGATSRPSAKPAPASAPAQSRPAGTVTPETPEVMADVLHKRPHDPSKQKRWDDMTGLEREDALREYEKKLTEWQERTQFIGRRVAWALTVQESEAVEGGWSVKALSRDGFLVMAVFAAGDQEKLSKVTQGDAVTIAGRIHDYKFEDTPGEEESIFDPGSCKLGVLLDGLAATPGREKPAADGK